MVGERRRDQSVSEAERDGVTALLGKVVDLLEQIKESVRADQQTFLWDFSTEVSAGADTEEVRIEIPYDGTITQLIVGWGEGSNQATGVKFKSAEGAKYIPRNDDDDAEFIGMDDHVLPPIPLGVDVEAGDEFIAEYKNNDSDNSHFVNCEAYIRRD